MLLALYSGVFWGCFVMYRYSLVAAFKQSFSEFILNALADADHVYVIVFSWLLAGMVPPPPPSFSLAPLHSADKAAFWPRRHQLSRLAYAIWSWGFEGGEFLSQSRNRKLFQWEIVHFHLIARCSFCSAHRL